MSNLHYLYISPLGRIASKLLERLRVELGSRLFLPCRLMEAEVLPEEAMCQERGQYLSPVIVEHVLNLCPIYAIKILGVCSVDLCVPILTFIFGQAQLNGLAALVSTARFHEEFYRKPPNEVLASQRTLKESLHELGNTFGLTHCQSSLRTMSLASKIELIDEKKEVFWNRCWTLMGPKLKMWRKE